MVLLLVKLVSGLTGDFFIAKLKDKIKFLVQILVEFYFTTDKIKSPSKRA